MDSLKRDKLEREILRLRNLIEPVALDDEESKNNSIVVPRMYMLLKPLYQTPEEVPRLVEDVIKPFSTFSPRLKSYLSRKYLKRFEEEQKQREKFIEDHRKWAATLPSDYIYTSDNGLAAGTQQNLQSSHRSHSQTAINLKPAEGRNFSNTRSAPGISMTMGRTSLRRFGTGGAILTDAVHSEEEMNRVILKLLQQERENPATRWMATLAVVPPMLGSESKNIVSHHFHNINGLVSSSAVEFNSRKSQVISLDDSKSNDLATVVFADGNCVWTRAEERIFVDKYIAYPKNFAKISSYLPYKSTSQVIAFYYLSKKRLQLRKCNEGIIHSKNLGRNKGVVAANNIVIRRRKGGETIDSIEKEETVDTKSLEVMVEEQPNNIIETHKINDPLPSKNKKSFISQDDGESPLDDKFGNEVSNKIHLMEQLLLASDIIPASDGETPNFQSATDKSKISGKSLTSTFETNLETIVSSEKLNIPNISPADD